MATSQTPNLYRPLVDGEIRLVKLFLGSWHEEVKCELVYISLDKAVEDKKQDFWQAISYVWGDPKQTVNIKLDNQQFPVTTNLFNFLRSFRYVHTNKKFDRDPSESECPSDCSHIVLWIDAICINQKDLRERAVQITHMTKIYAEATLVTAYVGELDEAKQAGFDRLVNYCWQMDSRESVDSIDRSIQGDIEAGELSTFHLLADTLMDLFERPFFSRVWIVQELVMGSRTLCVMLMCGTRMVQLNALKTLTKGIILPASVHLGDDRLSIFSTVVWPCFSLEDTLREYSSDTLSAKARRLLWLLHATWSHKTTDPRDKIYGVLGLFDVQELPSELVPSYEIPPEQVYHNYTKWLIKNTGDASILEGRPLVHDSLPSWVTDMALPTRAEFIELIYKPTGGIAPRPLGTVRLSEDQRMVLATGLRFGQVTTVYEGISSNEITDHDFALKLVAFEDYIVQKLCEHRPSDSRDTILDHIISSISPVLSKTHLARKAYTDTVTCLSPGKYNISIQAVPGQAVPLHFKELDLLVGNNWMLLDNDSVWHAPAANGTNYRAPAWGDLVYYFKGSDNAAIIRHDTRTHKKIRIDRCFNYDALIDLQELTEEEWSAVDAEEVAIS